MSDDQIQQALDKLPPILKQSLDRNLCSCNEVPTMTVIAAIVNGAYTLEAVTQQTYAADGIGCCSLQVEDLLEYLAPAVDSSSASALESQ